MLKKINLNVSGANISHRLRVNHQDVLEGFHHIHTHPMRKRSAPSIRTYNFWIIYVSNTNDGMLRRWRGADGHCRVRESKQTESRDHVLSSCDVTVADRVKFVERLQETSPQRHRELQVLPVNLKSTWIPVGYTSRRAKPFPVRNNRIMKMTIPLLKGSSVNPANDKADPPQCLETYNEYTGTLDSIAKQHVRSLCLYKRFTFNNHWHCWLQN